MAFAYINQSYTDRGIGHLNAVLSRQLNEVTTVMFTVTCHADAESTTGYAC